MIWPTTDRIPHSLIFKRMQTKWIADNIRAFSFLLTNWYKEPHEERIYRWTEFFHKLDNSKWKMHTGARARKQKYLSIYISLYMKTFLKTGVYIYIYIYTHTKGSRKRLISSLSDYYRTVFSHLSRGNESLVIFTHG